LKNSGEERKKGGLREYNKGANMFKYTVHICGIVNYV
jgi:hypothetical protein